MQIARCGGVCASSGRRFAGKGARPGTGAAASSSRREEGTSNAEATTQRTQQDKANDVLHETPNTD